MATETTTKWCKKCEAETERYEDGKCKPCKSARNKTWREANPERQRAYYKSWLQDNRERKRAADKSWCAANQYRDRERKKKWREADPDRVRQRGREGARRRRARKAENGVEPYRDADIFERDGHTCQLCGESIDMTLSWPDPKSKSIDHIVPLSKGGGDTPDNVQAAHLGCNCVKGNRVA